MMKISNFIRLLLVLNFHFPFFIDMDYGALSMGYGASFSHFSSVGIFMVFCVNILILESALPNAKSVFVFALHIPKHALGKSRITQRTAPVS